MVTLEQLHTKFGSMIPMWYSENVHKNVIEILFNPNLGKLHACKYLRDTFIEERTIATLEQRPYRELLLSGAKDICDFIQENAESTNKLNEIVFYHESKKSSCLSTTHNISTSEFLQYKIFNQLILKYKKFTVEVIDEDIKITISSKQD